MDTAGSAARSLACMRVVVGPVSVRSAEEWLTYARQVLGDLDDLAPGECFSTPEARSIFDAYLTEWEATAAAAGRDGEFLWEYDVAPEEIEYHVHTFHQLATMLAKREADEGAPYAPEGSREFYSAVLRGALGALEAEGPASAAFAQELRQFWPGEDLEIN